MYHLDKQRKFTGVLAWVSAGRPGRNHKKILRMPSGTFRHVTANKEYKRLDNGQIVKQPN